MTLRAGIVGTGYAARVRADALLLDERSHLSAVAGRDYSRAVDFARRYGIQPMDSWFDLVTADSIDLVVVSTVSALHGEVVEAALNAGKHVAVEYPLSLELAQAERLLLLAANQDLLLHVEHIELLGGLHRTMRSHLPEIGAPTYVSYRTLSPKHPAPVKWSYRQDLFGFPFCGALSRVHRLTNLFGAVASVDCCTRIDWKDDDSGYYRSILSSGRLQFTSGLIAELTYGKGENIWTACRTIDAQGTQGSLAFSGNSGTLVTADGTHAVQAAPRKGLIALDTQAVLAHLTEGVALYVKAADSVYALRVGDALRRASSQGNTVTL